VVLEGGTEEVTIFVEDFFIAEGVEGNNVLLCLKELGFVIGSVVRAMTGFISSIPDLKRLSSC
jgi:hypothetical protein